MRKMMRFVCAMLVLGTFFGGAGEVRAEPLYTALGERAGIVQIVDAATELWLQDDRIAATFADVNHVRFKRLLVDQLCQITGGPCRYGGRDMTSAHRGLQLDTRQFNALVEGLQSAMDGAGVSFFVQGRLLALLAPMYRDVVSR